MPDVRHYTKNSALKCFCSSLLLAIGFGSSLSAPALAIERATLELLTKPLEPTLFEADVPLDSRIGTPNKIEQTGLTPPSLWWKYEQFGGDLLRYWLAYPAEAEIPRRVDLVVEQQIWGSYNYVQRYAFVNQFGTTAKDFGYNLRVFNLQGELLGAHLCQFEQATAGLDTACTILLNPYGQGAFRGNAIPGVLSPTGGDRIPGR